MVARRLLNKIALDKEYEGKNALGEDYNVTDDMSENKKPFKCCLDVGLSRTTTGNRVFGVLKGALDGGLNIPHSTKRFPGAGKKDEYNADAHRDRIYGKHVQDYMEQLKEEEPEKYKRQFKKWIEGMKKLKVTNLETLYKKAHGEIRKNPVFKPTVKKTYKYTEKSGKVTCGKKSWKRDRKITNEERKKRVAQKIQRAIDKHTN